jgi:RNA recognition motif. (a.k.a. RRM, RBD, or RNP domain)
MEDTLHGIEECQIHKCYHPDSSRLLFVGGLALEATEDHLVAHFLRFGQVTSAQIQRRPTGKSKGFAYLQFGCPNSAQAAASTPGQVVLGSVITVQMALSAAEKRAAEESKLRRKVFVSRIPSTIEAGELAGLFSKFGQVETITQLKLKPQATHKSCILVWKNQEIANRLCAMRKVQIPGGPTLVVKPVGSSSSAIISKNQLYKNDRNKFTAYDFKPKEDFYHQKTSGDSRFPEEASTSVSYNKAFKEINKHKQPNADGKDQVDKLDLRIKPQKPCQHILKIRAGLQISVREPSLTQNRGQPADHCYILKGTAEPRAVLAGFKQLNFTLEPNLVFNVQRH